MKNVIKTLEPNTKGRDFVVGDIHGSYELVIRLLDGVNFDGEVDRLISVGDLVDRGPDSILCLQLLNEPWFHCVLSNHEYMMLTSVGDDERSNFWGGVWLMNGGMWGLPYLQEIVDFKRDIADGSPNNIVLSPDTEVFLELLEKVQELPYLITINRPNGSKFHVIHAELPPGHMISDADLANPEIVKELGTKQTDDGDVILWGRYKFGMFVKEDLSNLNKNIRKVQRTRELGGDDLSHIISGHSILQRPMTILGQTNIDTGAYLMFGDDPKKWNALTAVELGTWTFYQVRKSEFIVVDPLVINKEDLTKEENNG